MRRSLPAAFLGVVPLLAGCYEYVHASSPSRLVGHPVEIVLTDAGAAAESGPLGASIEAVDGTYLADSAGAYVLAVRRTRARTGEETGWKGERVAIPAQHVASLLERRFSPSRTAVAGGLAAAGVIGATIGLRGAGGASGGASTPKPIGSQ